MMTDFAVQMWSVGNYHWYLKQEFVLSNEKLVGMVWDPELVYKIHFLLSGNVLLWFGKLNYCKYSVHMLH